MGNLCIEIRSLQSDENGFLCFSVVVIGETRASCYKLFTYKEYLLFRSRFVPYSAVRALWYVSQDLIWSEIADFLEGCWCC